MITESHNTGHRLRHRLAVALEIDGTVLFTAISNKEGDTFYNGPLFPGLRDSASFIIAVTESLANSSKFSGLISSSPVDDSNR